MGGKVFMRVAYLGGEARPCLDQLGAALAVKVFGLPVTVWGKEGYMNGLARYYKKTRSLGVELRFAEF